MRVFLIHGMGRSPASMQLLAARLRRAGHTPSRFGYAVRRETLRDIAARFAQHIAETCAADDPQRAGPPAPYAVIGHSLGNVITRLASPRLPAGFVRFAMLAPPNQSPRLAQRLRNLSIFQLLTGDAGQALADPRFFETLPIPDVPTLIVAADAGAMTRLLPYGKGRSDGVVGVEETALPHLAPQVVPGVHTFIMNQKPVTETIMRFIDDPQHAVLLSSKTDASTPGAPAL